MKPPPSILDPAFRYTSSLNTDLRAKFARITKERAEQAAAEAEAARQKRVEDERRWAEHLRYEPELPPDNVTELRKVKP